MKRVNSAVRHHQSCRQSALWLAPVAKSMELTNVYASPSGSLKCSYNYSFFSRYFPASDSFRCWDVYVYLPICPCHFHFTVKREWFIILCYWKGQNESQKCCIIPSGSGNAPSINPILSLNHTDLESQRWAGVYLQQQKKGGEKKGRVGVPFLDEPGMMWHTDETAELVLPGGTIL